MKKFRKAYVAAGAALATGLGTNLLDGSLTSGEVLASVGAGLLAGAAVYKVSNLSDLISPETARKSLPLD